MLIEVDLFGTVRIAFRDTAGSGHLGPVIIYKSGVQFWKTQRASPVRAIYSKGIVSSLGASVEWTEES